MKLVLVTKPHQILYWLLTPIVGMWDPDGWFVQHWKCEGIVMGISKDDYDTNSWVIQQRGILFMGGLPANLWRRVCFSGLSTSVARFEPCQAVSTDPCDAVIRA